MNEQYGPSGPIGMEPLPGALLEESGRVEALERKETLPAAPPNVPLAQARGFALLGQTWAAERLLREVGFEMEQAGRLCFLLWLLTRSGRLTGRAA